MSEPHAIVRARERYGVDLTPRALADLCAQIAAGRSMLCGRRPGGCEMHIIAHCGVCMAAVWAPLDGAIVTFLPRRMISLRKRRKRAKRRSPRDFREIEVRA